MEFRVLDPVEVWHEGRPLELGPPKQLAVVAKLLQHANQVVSVSPLIETLWGEAAPDTAPSILHTYVYRLRRVLRPSGNGRTSDEVLCTKPRGYMLKVEEGQLDLDRFESLVTTATGAAARGEHETATRLLRSALGRMELSRGRQPPPACGERLADDPMGRAGNRAGPRLEPLGQGCAPPHGPPPVPIQPGLSRDGVGAAEGADPRHVSAPRAVVSGMG